MSGHAYTAGEIPRGHSVERSGRPGAGRPPAGALWLAGLCLLGLALIWVLAELVPAVQVKDAALLEDFTRLEGSHVHSLATFLLRLLEIGRAHV